MHAYLEPKTCKTRQVPPPDYIQVKWKEANKYFSLASSVQDVVACSATAPRVCTLDLFISASSDTGAAPEQKLSSF